MQILRSLSARNYRDAFSRLSCPRLLALFLIVIVPGGLVLPICYGIYGAIRTTLAGKVASRTVDAGVTAAISEAPPR